MPEGVAVGATAELNTIICSLLRVLSVWKRPSPVAYTPGCAAEGTPPIPPSDLEIAIAGQGIEGAPLEPKKAKQYAEAFI